MPGDLVRAGGDQINRSRFDSSLILIAEKAALKRPGLVLAKTGNSESSKISLSGAERAKLVLFTNIAFCLFFMVFQTKAKQRFKKLTTTN